MITLGQQFTRDCVELQNRITNWPEHLKQRLRHVHEVIGVRWKAEAVKRVPVDTSRLKQSIMKNVYLEGGYMYVTEVGTNIEKYPVYLEFGTQYIAKGAVLALGDSTDLTDQEAIHMWPAKAADAIATTSVAIDAQGNRLNIAGGHAGAGPTLGGPQEQMPWLRPAFNSIKIWVIDSLNAVITAAP